MGSGRAGLTRQQTAREPSAHAQPMGSVADVQMGKLRHTVCLVLRSQGMSSPAPRGAGQSSAATQGKVPSAHGPITHWLHPGRAGVPGMQLPVPVPVRLHAAQPSTAARIRAQPLGSAGGGCSRSPEPTQGCRDGMQGWDAGMLQSHSAPAPLAAGSKLSLEAAGTSYRG